jgi:hypothetical protein
MARTTIISIVIFLTLLSMNLCIAANKSFLQKTKEQKGKVSRYCDSDYYCDSESGCSDSCSSGDDEERTCSCGCGRDDCDCSLLQTETNAVDLNSATSNVVNGAVNVEEEDDDEEEDKNITAAIKI